MHAVNMLITPSKLKETENAKPYCQCFPRSEAVPLQQELQVCYCGEEAEVWEWHWQVPEGDSQSWVVFEDSQKQVMFHPFYSSGLAAVRGDTPFQRDRHYYWEIKMLTDTYGTEIMVGLGTDRVNIEDSRFTFASLLGADEYSYGLSYRGTQRHRAGNARETDGFCRGTIVGVRVDMWHGTLEFYLNRRPQGICFSDLRRHHELFPIVCSTAAQSVMRLVYADSWRPSLLVDAAKILSSAGHDVRDKIPLGLKQMLPQHFWLLMPIQEESDDAGNAEMEVDEDDDENVSIPRTPLSMMILEIYGPKFFPCT